MKIKIKNLYSSIKTLNIAVVLIIVVFIVIKFSNYEKYELSFQVESRSLDEIQSVLASEQVQVNPLYHRLFIKRVGIGKAKIYLVTQDKLNEGKFFLNYIRNLFLKENEDIKNKYIRDLIYINFLINNSKKKTINEMDLEFKDYEDLLSKNTNLLVEISKNTPKNYHLGEIKINILNENFVTLNDILSLIFFILFLYTFFYVFCYGIKKN